MAKKQGKSKEVQSEKAVRQLFKKNGKTEKRNESSAAKGMMYDNNKQIEE